jgi:Flp pilus assembly protein TadG
MKLRILRNFLSENRGNVATIFALALPVLVVGTGLSVDMMRLEVENVRLQKALDASALAAAKEYGKTQDKATLEKWAKAYFYTNAGRPAGMDTVFTYNGVTVVNGNAVMKVSATRKVPMMFGSTIMALSPGGNDKTKGVLNKFSEIIVQNRSIEMALVLDNSGSMKNAAAGGGGTKISSLKAATATLIDQMMAASASNVQYPVSMSVVPFSGAVNVGPDHASDPWMDTKGLSPAHHDDFDWSTWKILGVPQAIPKLGGGWVRVLTGEYLTRFYLYQNMKVNGVLRFPQGWTGCPQSRPLGLAVTDDEPTALRPETLFVPMFAPSEHNWSGSLSSLKNDWIPDTNNSGGNTDLAALARQRDMNKYFSNTSTNSNAEGPDQACNTRPITPLTKTKSVVSKAVADMEPLGGTNIAEGLAWGWRTLSSRAPFTEGKPAQVEDNMKILVLMTDGENTYNPAYSNGDQVDYPSGGRSMFGTHGYAQIVENGSLRPGRMFDATKTTVKKADIDNVTSALNEMTSIVCENIKSDGRNPDGSDGVVIFTIAFDLKDGSPVKERLRACASSGINGNGAKLYYDAKSSSDLAAAFQSITEEISSLRIAR